VSRLSADLPAAPADRGRNRVIAPNDALSAIYAMIERGQLPGVARIGRRVLVRSDALLRWINQKSTPSPNTRTTHPAAENLTRHSRLCALNASPEPLLQRLRDAAAPGVVLGLDALLGFRSGAFRTNVCPAALRPTPVQCVRFGTARHRAVQNKSDTFDRLSALPLPSNRCR